MSFCKYLKAVIAFIAMIHLAFLAGNQIRSGDIRSENEQGVRIGGFSYGALLAHLAWFKETSGSQEPAPFREEENSDEDSEPLRTGADPDLGLVEKAGSLVDTYEQSMEGFSLQLSPEFDDNGSLTRIFYNGLLKGPDGEKGMLHQSLSRASDGSLVMTVHHTEMPRGRGLAAEILRLNGMVLSLLSDSPHNRTELEAVTNSKGLVGAWGWARLGMEFAPGEREKVRAGFRDYLLSLFAESSKSEIDAWLGIQSLNSPSDYTSLPELPLALRNPWFSPGFKRLRQLRHFKKFAAQPGKAYLTDPTTGVSYFARKSAKTV